MRGFRLLSGVTIAMLAWVGVGELISTRPAVASVSRSRARCNPVGRIVSGEGGNFSRGKIICSGTRIEPTTNARMLCFRDRSIVRLTAGQSTVVNRQTCSGDLALSLEACQSGQAFQCFRAKGPEQSDFQLVEPSKTVAVGARPRISWQPVKDAREYTVRVSGSGVSWERTVRDTALTYPTNEAELKAGNAYQIVVIARLPNRNLTAATVVNRLPSN